MLHLSDLADPTGPYWVAYQATRARDGILDNPATVPPWFLAKTARERVAAARVEVERAAEARDENAAELYRALRVVEDHLSMSATSEPTIAAAVAGLLGAQEVATERERAEFEAEQVQR